LEIGRESLVLSIAGSGTGLVTLAFYDADSGRIAHRCVRSFSANSLGHCEGPVQERKRKRSSQNASHRCREIFLDLPFDDETFDLVLTCGVLEYVSLGRWASRIVAGPETGRQARFLFR
jgi:hypothetical protein